MADNEVKDIDDGTRETLINIIANSLNRTKSTGAGDTRNLLMLIAALGLLNASKESSLALAVARKLSSTAPKK